MFSKGELIGYLFLTKDITSSKGYSSQTFEMLVGLKRKKQGKNFSHKEPILGMYTQRELILPKFTEQYRDLDIRFLQLKFY